MPSCSEYFSVALVGTARAVRWLFRNRVVVFIDFVGVTEMRVLVLLQTTLATVALAANNGVARLPPMGWRSWNYFACDISEEVFERQIMALNDRSRSVDGRNTSLRDLGWNTVGIDDCWQDCTSPESFNGSYHTKDGVPLVDASKFPSGLKALNAKATEQGVNLV